MAVAVFDNLEAGTVIESGCLALTSRNWLMGFYIVEFEQNGEDRAAYGEQLLKNLEQRLKIKGLNDRRSREFRRLYLVYPQLKRPVVQYIPDFVTQEVPFL